MGTLYSPAFSKESESVPPGNKPPAGRGAKARFGCQEHAGSGGCYQGILGQFSPLETKAQMSELKFKCS